MLCVLACAKKTRPQDLIYTPGTISCVWCARLYI